MFTTWYWNVYTGKKSFDDSSKNEKPVLSSGKLKVTIFWNSYGVMLTEYVEKGKTIKEEYHVELLDNVEDNIYFKLTRKPILKCSTMPLILKR